MMRRLPISLRFDDETDFYNNFIVEKRDSRELSTLILDLLTVYYEDETVRQLVNNYINAQNPYLFIGEQLQRIAFEHSCRTVSTNLLSDYTNNEGKKIIKKDEKSGESKTDSELLALHAQGITPESLTPVITEVLKQFGIVGNISTIPNEPQPTINKIVEKTQEVLSQPKIETPVVEERPVIVQLNVESPVVDEKPIVLVPKSETVEPQVIPPSVANGEDNGGTTEKKAPKSFKKLLKSV